MTKPTDIARRDLARQVFVSHLLRLVNDDAQGHGYHLQDMTVHSDRTVLVYESDQPLVFMATPDDGFSGAAQHRHTYGTRRLTVTIEAEHERRDW